MSDHYGIQTRGGWTDHVTGDWLLTLDKKLGGFLSAALIIWVGLVATLFWNIVSDTVTVNLVIPCSTSLVRPV